MYCEVVSNPTLVVADLPRLADIAHAHKAALVVDNTFTPLAVSPVSWGADVVVHSLTKFVSGASDIIAGAVCGTADFVASLMDLHTGESRTWCEWVGWCVREDELAASVERCRLPANQLLVPQLQHWVGCLFRSRKKVCAVCVV